MAVTFSFGQRAYAQNNASGTGLSSAGINVATGSLIVVMQRWEGGGSSDAATISVTDSAGNTYTTLGHRSPGSGSEDARVGAAYCLAATGGASLTITATLSAARSYRVLDILVFTYSGGTIQCAATGSGYSGTDTTSVTSSPALSAASGDLLIGCLANYNSSPHFSPEAGYTGYGDDLWHDIFYRIAPSAGSYSPGGTLSGGGDTYGLVTGLFSEAAAGGAISGSAALTFGTGSSALTGTGALAGTSALVFDDGSSVLTAMGALAGSSALVFAGSATAGAPGVLAGSAALVFANSATLVGGGALAGSAAMVTGAGSSTLTGAGALAGASALVFGAGSTVLTGTGALAGVSAVVFSASLQAEGSIAGSVALVFGAGASTLTALGALAGNAALTLDGAGTLSRIVDTVLTGPTRITHGEGWTRFEAGERVTLIAFSQPATRVH